VLDGDDGGAEVVAIALGQLAALIQQRVGHRAGGRGGVVDLVRQQADQLVAGLLLRTVRFLGVLLDQQEVAGETAIVNVSVWEFTNR
jgi:hypothetical protein